MTDSDCAKPVDGDQTLEPDKNGGIFEGIKFYVAMDSETKDSFQKQLDIMSCNGGFCESYLSEIVNLVLGLNNDHPDSSYAKDILNIPVVHPNWVLHSWQAKKKLPYSLFDIGHKHLLSGLKFAQHGLSENDSKSIWALIMLWGGCCVDSDESAMSDVDYCLTTSRKSVEHIEKLVPQRKFKFVTPTWIVDCIKGETILPADEYDPLMLKGQEPVVEKVTFGPPAPSQQQNAASQNFNQLHQQQQQMYQQQQNFVHHQQILQQQQQSQFMSHDHQMMQHYYHQQQNPEFMYPPQYQATGGAGGMHSPRMRPQMIPPQGYPSPPQNFYHMDQQQQAMYSGQNQFRRFAPPPPQTAYRQPTPTAMFSPRLPAYPSGSQPQHPTTVSPQQAPQNRYPMSPPVTSPSASLPSAASYSIPP